MKGNALLVTVIAALALSAVVGVGFAVTYTAVSTTSGNTLDYAGDTVEIVDSSGNPIQAPLSIAGPTVDHVGNQVVVTHNTVWLSSYKLKVSAAEENLQVQCMINLEDARTWAIIEDMSLTINDGSSNRELDFLVNGTTSVPSAVVSLPTGVYSFAFSITYKAVTLDLNGTEDTDFLDLSGSTLKFVAGKNTPVPLS